MKRTISFVLSVIMVLTVFVSVPLIKVDAQAADASEIFTVTSSGLKNGKVTYTVYINPKVSFSGAVIYTTFDTAALTLVSGGAATTVDSYGDEYETIPGIYVSGFSAGYNNRYSVGYMSSDLSKDYTCGSTKKPFVKFVFKPAKTSNINTSVKIYCDEFSAVSETDNKITHGSEVLLESFAVQCNHSYGDWVTAKKATAVAAGSKYRECSKCGTRITASIPQLKPATPKLTAIANTASGVKVSWGKVTGADSYIVYRRTYDAKAKKWGGWTNIAKSVTTNSYVDKTAKSGTYYLYTVKAVNEAGNSGYNTSGIKTYFLTVPKSVTTANTTYTITVKWGKVAGATGYIVYRKTTGGWTRLGTTKGTSFADKTANVGVTYRYTVKAYYGSYVSAYNTNGYAVRRLTIPTLKSAVSSKTGITFTWNKVTGATGYIVYRKTGSGSWQRLGTVKTNTYLDKTAKKGVTYKYTVKAYYGTSTSHYNSKGLAVKDKY